MEIERQWMLSKIPDHVPYSKYEVSQSYLHATIPEVRIRSTMLLASPPNPGNVQYVPAYEMTIKGDGALERTEVNVRLDKDAYKELLSLVKERPIHKTRYNFPLNDGHTLEVSIVDQSWIYAEVEFSAREDAEVFVFPYPECGPREITNEPQFKMRNYWIRTRAQ